MVRRQLDTLQDHAAVRLRYARIYAEGVAGLPGVLLPPLRDDGSAVYNYFPIQYADREALVRWAIYHGRDMAVQHLKNCAGLESFAAESCACPEAAATASQTILLPNYPAYGDEEVRRNVDVIRRFFAAGCPRV
jgi:dTDP-4-amino-4,6-dideoxygalactose transaminase